MKTKILLMSLVLILSTRLIMGQITITYHDFPPIPYSTWEYVPTTLENTDISPNGANQIWDLSGLIAADSTPIQISDLANLPLSLIHISEPTRLLSISYAVFCLKKKTN